MKYLLYMTVVIFCSLLSGCFSPVKLKPESTYLLSATPHVSVKQTHPITLMIIPPSATSVYDTTQMAYSISPYQIAYYEKNRWAETPAQMLQPLIIQALQNTHYFHAVITPPTLGHYDYVLNTQLIQLLQDYTVRPAIVRLKLRAELVQVAGNRVVAVKEFVVTAPIHQCTPYGGVFAANKAVSRLLTSLVDFCTHRSGR